MEERYADEGEGADAVMMPPMPLMRPRREDKVSELDRFVRAEYKENCASWTADGFGLEAGTCLPRASSPSSGPGGGPATEGVPGVDRRLADGERVLSRI